MKSRSDFVTNSSSSSFIMAFKDDDKWSSYDNFANRCMDLYYDSFYNLIEELQMCPENVDKEKALELLYWYYSYEYRFELIDSLLKLEDYASYQEYYGAKLELEESEEFKKKAPQSTDVYPKPVGLLLVYRMCFSENDYKWFEWNAIRTERL